MARQKKTGPCIFCGDTTDETEEHVIPDWMQRDKSLKSKSQNYKLPNHTDYRYLHAKLPACEKHNKMFGAIETNIKNGIIDPDEVYLWAFKVHVGLMLIDSDLKQDIKDPQSPKIVDRRVLDHDVEEFRTLFRIWSTGQHRFVPSPLGSVFLLPSLTPDFDFVHSYPGRCMGINLGEFFLAVFLYDLGHAKRAGMERLWNPQQLIQYPDYFSDQDRTQMDHQRKALNQRVWLCETAYWAYRLELPDDVYVSDNTYLIPGWQLRPYLRPENNTEYELFAQSFGLEVVNGQDNDQLTFYRPLVASGFYKSTEGPTKWISAISTKPTK